MWDPVPWLVGGGAEHSPEVARLLAYASTSGAEGVVSPGDLKVSALTVPGASVRVAEGSALVRSRAAGGDQQTYVGRNVGQDVVDVAATGSGSGRSDLVVLRIEDPFAPGEPWDEPADAKVGPYIYTRVIPGVSPTTTDMPAGMTGLPLARIDIPANTATITNDMITDLRGLAIPRTSRELVMGSPTPEVPANNTLGEVWPDYNIMVRVPDWATHATVAVTLTSVGHRGGNSMGYLAAVLGTLRSNNILYDLDNPEWAGERATLVVAGEFNVQGIAGTMQNLQLEARKLYADTHPGYLVTVSGTQVVYDVQFYERVV